MTDYGGLIEGVGSAIVSVLGLTRTFNLVKEGELGIKLRFGKAKREQDITGDWRGDLERRGLQADLILPGM
jgi:hypothetical protein